MSQLKEINMLTAVLWTEIKWSRKKNTQRWVWRFPRTADKEKNNYRGTKNLFNVFWELFLRRLVSLITPVPKPRLILYFNSKWNDFTLVTEPCISSFFPLQNVQRGTRQEGAQIRNWRWLWEEGLGLSHCQMFLSWLSAFSLKVSWNTWLTVIYQAKTCRLVTLPSKGAGECSRQLTSFAPILEQSTFY